MKQIKSTSKHRWLGILILIFLAVIFSCSTVFTASIQGKVVLRYMEEVKKMSTETEEEVESEIEEEIDDDEEAEVEYEEKEKALQNVLVFLYDSKEKWEDDFNFFDSENPKESLPNSPGRENYRYYQSSETNSQGEYSFSGFMWQTNNPGYGKTGDRREVYILLYPKDYGLYKNLSPVYIISNATTNIPTFYFDEADKIKKD